MSPESFQALLDIVGPRISKQSTQMRESLSAAERLALTVRYLASGDSQISLSFAFRIGKSTVSNIVAEVSESIWLALKEKYVPFPSKKEQWKQISDDFYKTWNLPHCIGALDGKHVRIVAPKLSGTLYHNYKGYFSTVLLAICDAKYNIIYVNVEEYGSNNDSGVLNNSWLPDIFENRMYDIPEPEPIPGFKMEEVLFFFGG